jgi:hypothetical protein
VSRVLQIHLTNLIDMHGKSVDHSAMSTSGNTVEFYISVRSLPSKPQHMSLVQLQLLGPVKNTAVSNQNTSNHGG